MIWLWRLWNGIEDKILASITPMNEAWLSDLRRQSKDEYPISIGRKAE